MIPLVVKLQIKTPINSTTGFRRRPLWRSQLRFTNAAFNIKSGGMVGDRAAPQQSRLTVSACCKFHCVDGAVNLPMSQEARGGLRAAPTASLSALLASS
jgi:hypothetical protein